MKNILSAIIPAEVFLQPVIVATKRVNSGGKFKGGVMRFGLANSGVDYAMDSNNEKLVSADMKKRLEDLRVRVVSGKIQVPDYYKKK